MEVLSVVAAAMAFAGGEAAKTAIGEGVKDAYRAAKEFLLRKYPQIDLTKVETAPQSVLVGNLISSGAAADAEFSPLAKRLVDAVAAEVRETGPQPGVRLDDFESASLTIDDVIASGTGVLIKKARIEGHAQFTGIRGGQNPKK